MTTVRKGAWLRYAAESVGLAVAGPAVFVGSLHGLARLGLRAPALPWAEPGGWVPGTALPFPWAYCVGYLVGLVLVPAGFELLTRRDELADMGLGLPRGWRAYIALAVVLIALPAYQRLAYWLVGQRLPHLLEPTNVAYFAGLWACVAWAEEFFLRSVLQRRMTHLLGQLPAIIVVAAGFALLGHNQAPVVENLLYRFPAGVVLGWLFARHKSVLPPAACHFVANLAAFA